jgi:predicted MFS family arabinose efflux permease
MTAVDGGADRLNRRTRLWQAAALVSTFDRFVLPPMLVVIAHELGVSLAEVVSAVAAYFLAYGLSQPLWGFISHRFGVVRSARAALALAGLLSLATAFAWSAPALGILRGLSGGFYGSAYPSSLIYIGETVPSRSRQAHLARLLIGVALGTSLGTLLGGVVADHLSWRLAFLLPGLAALILSLFMGRLPEPLDRSTSAPISAQLKAMARLPILYAVVLFAFVEGGLILGGLTLMPTALEYAGHGTSLAAGLTALYGVAVLIGAQAVQRFSARMHPAVMILVGGICATAALFVFSYSQGVVPAIVTASLLGVGWTFMHTTLQAWATEILPAARALVISLFAGCLFAGVALQAVVVQDLADHAEFMVIYFTMSLVGIALTACAALIRLRWQRSRGSDPGTR